MVEGDLKKKAVKGAVWSAVQRFLEMGTQFVSGIVLARLLMPEDYGIVGMLAIFLLLSQTFLDGGFGSALIQKKNPTKEDYSTIFFWNLGMSVFLYTTLFLSAPFIAKFYNMDILCPVLRTQAVVLFIAALSMVQGNIMTKQFRFKELSIVSVFVSVFCLTITIVMAYRGYGVWSLVIPNLIGGVVRMSYFWIAVRWFPSFVFSFQSFKSLFSFGVYMCLTSLVNETCNNIHGILIGRFFSATTMGYFSKARGTEKLASTSISQSLMKVTFPLYAEYQNDNVGLKRLIRKLTVLVSFITFPLMFWLILIAKPIFVILYSDRWLASIPYFQILCIAGLAICLQALNAQAIVAIGKSKTNFSWTVIKRGVGLIFVLLGLYFAGIYGLVCGSVASSWFSYLVNAHLVSQHIGYCLKDQIKNLLPILFVSLLSFVGSYYVGCIEFLNMYIEGLVQSIIFFVLYVGMAYLLKLKSLDVFKEMLPLIIKR